MKPLWPDSPSVWHEEPISDARRSSRNNTRLWRSRKPLSWKGSPHRSAASATPTTTPWPRPRSGYSRPKPSAWQPISDRPVTHDRRRRIRDDGMGRLVQQPPPAQPTRPCPTRGVPSRLLRSPPGVPAGDASTMKPASNPGQFRVPTNWARRPPIPGTLRLESAGSGVNVLVKCG